MLSCWDPGDIGTGAARAADPTDLGTGSEAAWLWSLGLMTGPCGSPDAVASAAPAESSSTWTSMLGVRFFGVLEATVVSVTVIRAHADVDVSWRWGGLPSWAAGEAGPPDDALPRVTPSANAPTRTAAAAAPAPTERIAGVKVTVISGLPICWGVSCRFDAAPPRAVPSGSAATRPIRRRPAHPPPPAHPPAAPAPSTRRPQPGLPRPPQPPQPPSPSPPRPDPPRRPP